MATPKQKHLPLLHNPLLNCIFNNPLHEKLAVKSTILQLSLAHNDYAILVPPAHILQECHDDSAQKLADLCYHNDDFVRSHIIKISVAFSATTAPVTKVQLIIYNTMNGKQVLVKNRMVFTGKGFKKSMKLSIVDVGHFVSFCDYFPKGSRFLLLYIEDLLFGHKNGPPALLAAQQIPPETKTPASGPPEVTFERILRTFPLLSQAMSEHFYVLFHHNNRQFQRLRTRRRMKLDAVVEDFRAIVDETNKIVEKCVLADTADGERAYNLINAVLRKYPTLDLDTLLHEYVELNIYDNLWLQLVFQYQNYKEDDDIGGDELPRLILTPSLYKDLSCLSLNQLEVPADEPWYVNVLYKRVSDAIEVFSRLADPSTSHRSLKVRILTETINILTEGSTTEKASSDFVVDADTLIGLSIMVVVHSKVPNLEAHLYYVRHFECTSHFVKEGSHKRHGEDSGFLNYIISNFEAVIYHLSLGKLNVHLEELSVLSTQNYKLWSAIQKKSVVQVQELLDEVEEEFDGQTLPRNHYLRSRNIHGESCFTFAIHTRNSDLFHTLMSRTAQWFLFEELLFDKNTSSDQNLLMLALQEEAHDMVMEIIDILEETASVEEQVYYYNSRDVNGRSVGHYLSHDIEALERIGHLIDWRAKDINSYTPLLSLCRCYDHPNYKDLIAKAFACVNGGHSDPVTYDDHTDKSGNTLLHVIANDIDASGLLDEKKSLIDVNQLNDKQLSPVGVYMRYSRVENLERLFKDKRLIFDLEDPKNFYNILDYYSFSASRSQGGNLDTLLKVRLAVVTEFFRHNFPSKIVIEFGAMNARYDGNLKDWLVNIVYKDSGDPAIASVVKFVNVPSGNPAIATKYISLSQLRQLVKIHTIASPLSFSLSPEAFWVNFPAHSSTIPFCSKFRVNRILEHLTLLFLSMSYRSRATQTSFLQSFSLCCRNDSVLVLDYMNEYSHQQELEKTKLGEIKLSQRKIEEIEYFLEFSKTDLVKYRTQISRLAKLTAVGGVKQCDLRSVYDHLLSKLPQASSSELDVDKEHRVIDAPYHKFHSYVSWIEMSVFELVKNCGVVSEKLQRWKLIYSRIKDLNVEIYKFEEQVVTHENDHKKSDQALVHSDQSLPAILRRSTLSIDAVPLDEDESKTSTFFGLIDSKKSRYRKLLHMKAEEVKKLMELNVEIKLDHEVIAAEISHFLAFRLGFIAFAIKQFTKSSLVLLRHRHYELTKTLHTTKHSHH